MVYLDYNASTPLDHRLAGVVAETTQRVFGNPSSRQHGSGQAAAQALDLAREQVGRLLGAPARDVVWTSGATEALTLGLLGVVLGQGPGRDEIVVAATEHKAVFSAAELAVRLGGGRLRVAPVMPEGTVDIDALRELVDERTAIVAVMAVNNETGVINPVSAVSKLCEKAGAPFLCDATQAIGRIPFSTHDIGAQLTVLSSHKMYGPKGAGALVVDREIRSWMVPLMPGGGQERGLRGGTQNTPAIVGLGAAAGLVEADLASDVDRLDDMSAYLVKELEAGLGRIRVHGQGAKRVCNTVNVQFVDADAEQVMFFMPDVEVSAGSACQSATPTPSHVLTAMGVSAEEASQSIRISLGRQTTVSDLDYSIDRIVHAVQRVRAAK